MLLLTVVVFKLLVLAPPFVIWRTRSWRAAGWTVWHHRALALLGPGVFAFVSVVLLWLPTYSGQCGGWLGETSPCRGFGQFVAETTRDAARRRGHGRLDDPAQGLGPRSLMRTLGPCDTGGEPLQQAEP
jgi:hypothetical protein